MSEYRTFADAAQGVADGFNWLMSGFNWFAEGLAAGDWRCWLGVAFFALWMVQTEVDNRRARREWERQQSEK